MEDAVDKLADGLKVDHGGRIPSRGVKSGLVTKRRRNERLSAQMNDLIERRRERCGRKEQ
jgi:hypothetical protein